MEAIPLSVVNKAVESNVWVFVTTSLFVGFLIWLVKNFTGFLNKSVEAQQATVVQLQKIADVVSENTKAMERSEVFQKEQSAIISVIYDRLLELTGKSDILKKQKKQKALVS